MRIDVEDMKQSLRNLHGIEPYEGILTFFYDESGNCRKFSLTKNGVNFEDSLWGDFVLAGVAYDGVENNIDFCDMYQALEYKEGQKELKFKHLYHNSSDFCSFLNSKRLTGFLRWLRNSGLFVHYSALNNLFYSLVDIVDSLWEDFPQCIIYIWDIKSALYDFTVEHCDEIIDLLFRYGYPNVTQCRMFCSELCDIILYYNDDNEYDSGFYLELCEMFSQSRHFFDEEVTVQKQLSGIQLYENGQQINNYFFEKSHENIYIQISDMIAGLLRKLFAFLDATTFQTALSLSKELNETQKRNLMVILELITISDHKSVLFIKNANTPKNIQDRMAKLHILAGV